jgi:hypothetical protein
MRKLIYIGFVLFAATGSAHAEWSQTATCVVDGECTDHIFCNGAERCRPGAPGAQPNGCIRANPMDPCGNSLCRERELRCWVPQIDDDHDGHSALRIVLPSGREGRGGDDCNDNDSNEFPGNFEHWDTADHDEDCNPNTHGEPPGALRLHAQICSGDEVIVREGETYRHDHCDKGQACVTQPSGAGVCEIQSGKWAPAPVTWVPSGPQRISYSRTQVGPSGGESLAPVQSLPNGVGPGKPCPPGTVRNSSGRCVRDKSGKSTGGR